MDCAGKTFNIGSFAGDSEVRERFKGESGGTESQERRVERSPLLFISI